MATIDAIGKSCFGAKGIEVLHTTFTFGIVVYSIVSKETFSLIVCMLKASGYIEECTTILEAQLTKYIGSLYKRFVVVLVFVSFSYT